MARVHLMELEDQAWFPQLIRDFGTDMLQFNQTKIDQSEGIADKLTGALATSGARRVVDLCSGGSGPWLRLVEHLDAAGHRVPVLLTDKFPNLPALQRARDESAGRIDLREEPVDATAVDPELTGLRTLFNGFHHFRHADARRILQDAVDQRQPIAIFEFLDRSPLSFIGVWFAAFLVLPVITPFIRPFRWNRLLFTYLIPLVPLLVLWDGTVSLLRLYSPTELRALCDALPENDYRWDIGYAKNTVAPTRIIYLTGVPDGG